jgi:hypothetical protein
VGVFVIAMKRRRDKGGRISAKDVIVGRRKAVVVILKG